MDRLLTKLRLRRKDKTEIKPLPKNVSPNDADYDSDYVLNKIDRSLTYDCKRKSLSYSILTEPEPELNNKRLSASASMGVYVLLH